jgi:uncharacterized protein (TIGR02246 family)
MPARKPQEANTLVVQAINDGDMEAALALYEPDASFVPEPGQVVTGREAIRQVLDGFMALKPALTIEVPTVVQSGDITLLYSEWSLTGTDADGGPLTMSGKGREVVRRQPNGDWLFVVDDPNGGG